MRRFKDWKTFEDVFDVVASGKWEGSRTADCTGFYAAKLDKTRIYENGPNLT